MDNNFLTRTQVAFHNLNGLVNGIAMDGTITKSEYEVLKAWCKTHQSLCSEEPFNTFFEEISSKVKTGTIGSEEIIELQEILEKHALSFQEKDKTKSNLHFLQGVCYGIMADGDINKYELEKLKKWMDENEYLSATYPFNEIYEVVEHAIGNRKIENEEYMYLSKYFKEFLKIE
ncbi:hypothetical protein LV84_03122 [Algoriphagus ratkowskyi]|uniref:Uncharacterized protein n=1 Tax=Algoriphagus ratkowskyi TaxID=57028 RepID=A0A2W7QY07_9BACT|nr:hypothetical protein [Algoriphagus ratkowskyi]PZX53398.1 hypothetical protein LV84_03122 [Algoriphagus ratkowskyi]TXD76556.1 hypothetical protein ESW18_16280 [Algoriphagus ratkowskyi]